jgi:hypothetical protein
MEKIKKNSDDMGLMRQDLQNQSLNPNAVQKIGTDINQLQTQQSQMLENIKEYHTSLRIQANEQAKLLGAQGANYNKRMNVQLGTITTEIAKLNTTADISQDLAMAHAITSLPVGSGHTKLEGQLDLYNVIQNHIKYPTAPVATNALALSRNKSTVAEYATKADIEHILAKINASRRRLRFWRRPASPSAGRRCRLRRWRLLCLRLSCHPR